MSGFLAQLRTLTVGSAHDLLDKAIDLNSPSMVRQRVRDIEDALGKLNSEAAIAEGQLRTLNREQSELTQKIETDKAMVAKLLESTDPKAAGLARAKAGLIVVEQKQLTQKLADIQTQQSESDKLQGAVANLQAQHDQMASRVRQLENLDRDSKAKEQAAKALTSAAEIMGSINASSIDNVESRVRQRNDVAGAKFDQAMGSMPAEDNSDDVNALLASLTPVAK